mmetsp:Transcript_17648/g.42955  ORF Transcript_17648/g.42955 Transcript_17648/m.42955 type:complete len:176 (-) Transcript_17648:2131-2658(-)
MTSSSMKIHPYSSANSGNSGSRGQDDFVYVNGETYTASNTPGSYQAPPPTTGSGTVPTVATLAMSGSTTTNAAVTGSVVSPPPAQSHYSMMEQRQYVYIDSRKPVTLTMCPKCTKEHVTTTTRTKPNGVTAICVVAGVFIFWPLCWLPLCIRPMKQTNHYCTCCGAKVGRVKPFQ